MSIQINYSSQADLEAIVDQITADIRHELERRTYLSANELRNASLDVLRGQRNGRRYKVPGTYARQYDRVDGKMRNGRYYTASAPGEPPAVRTGMFRLSWQPKSYIDGDKYTSSIESNIQVGTKRKYLLGQLLEEGTIRMAPRPYEDRILQQAEENIVKIYSRPV